MMTSSSDLCFGNTSSFVDNLFASAELVKALYTTKGVPHDDHNESSGWFLSLVQWDGFPYRLFLVAVSIYFAVAIVTNLIGLYKFVVAWNMIIAQQHIDLPEFCRRRRRMTYKDTIKLQLVPEGCIGHCCVICLSDFSRNEIVTSCEEGCRNWFHKE